MRNAWDCHAHVIEDPARFPLAPERTYDPPRAPLEDYLALLDRCGIAYGVLVQPSIYRFDNRCMLAALERARGRLFGIAVPSPDTDARQLQDMHGQGVRGIRCNTVQPAGLRVDEAAAWSPVLRELGWHVELQVRLDDTTDLRGTVTRFDVPVVIDHMGLPATDARTHELIALVRDGACHVKLSAPYRFSHEPPPWRVVQPLAHALLDANAAHCLWATDWPHTNAEEIVHEHDLLGALRDWSTAPHTAALMLRDAPARLFGATPT